MLRDNFLALKSQGLQNAASYCLIVGLLLLFLPKIASTSISSKDPVSGPESESASSNSPTPAHSNLNAGSLPKPIATPVIDSLPSSTHLPSTALDGAVGKIVRSPVTVPLVNRAPAVTAERASSQLERPSQSFDPAVVTAPPGLPRVRPDRQSEQAQVTQAHEPRSSYDDQSRADTAQRLAELGFRTDWRAHSLAELLDWESRLTTANRLQSLGYPVDWRSYTLSSMLDCESRITTATRLQDLGLTVDWRSRSLSEMLDWESRIGTAERIKELGYSFDWHKYSLSQLLQMEIQIHRKQAGY